ncbi:uncharacterized protein LOC131691843 [Topomyia yanbarensis]|uniref:uncharacterized protein LOC131691843 n=1 Tax=Topomyia yanbarensis TaxID=2498891 RepID=UPI00273BC969|nr:uncharacterized protein LOC131691843 [Topomyia yanbarensis]
METPLCAVVDPARDFRWHALRCGGPETAAFLCELPVPNWAADCTVTSMPSLTVQYMSDSGAVQLSRDCGEQGTRHMSCQGKLDRDSIMQQLQCGDQEEDAAAGTATESTENNQLSGVDDVATPQQTSLLTRKRQPPEILEHDILTVVSNNEEDNNIDVNPNQIEDTVKNVINKFNLVDLMQGDQSLHSGEDGDQDKEGKKAGGKKYSPLFEKKEKFDKKGEKKMDEEDEMMMGDQPDETETQPIDIVQQAVKPTEGDSDEGATAVVVVGGSTETVAVSSEVTPTESTTMDSRLRRSTDGEAYSDSTLASSTEVVTTEASTTTMEPTTSSTASHILPTTPKKELASIGDHFIPPMLMVKAHFSPTRAHVDTTTTELLTETPPTTAAPPTTSQVPSTTTEELSTTSQPEAIFSKEISSTEASSVMETDATTSHQIVEITFDDEELSSKIGTLSITTRQFTTDDTKLTTGANTEITSDANISTVYNATSTSEDHPSSTTIQLTSTTVAASSSTTTTVASTTTAPTTKLPSTTRSTSTTTTTTPAPVVNVQDHELHDILEDNDDHDSSAEEQEHHEELHNSFSNIENYQPYKPNRRRTLTKPEVHNNRGNYIKKILG